MKKSLSLAEIKAAFPDVANHPPVLTEPSAAALLRLAPKTLANWRRDRRLDGTWASPGQGNVLYWRDRLLLWYFNEEHQ